MGQSVVIQKSSNPAELMAGTDWNFADDHTRDAVHGIHPYPAKFIPQLPRKLINLFPPTTGGSVLDPFCGSGTTMVEAQAAGMPSVGIDLHPLATLIARVKTTPLEANLATAAQAIAISAQQTPAAVPDIPRLDHWFKPDVQEVLARVTARIRDVEDLALREALQVALSRIIVRVSKQESDTRYAAVDKPVTGQDVYDLFVRAAATVSAAVPSQVTTPARTLTRNILDVETEEVGAESVGLVVTSPPYPNAYEYWLYHKYRMYWLGMDPIAVRREEIGARPHYFKKDPQSEHDFQDQMARCFALLIQVMRPGAHAVFVVGRSIIRGREIDNAALLRRAAEPVGFELVAQAARDIPRSRKSFNPAVATIVREHLVAFRKPTS